MILNEILYVEDNPDIQEIALMALVEIGGFKVHVCSSGQEALDTLKTASPQLVLLDVMMPGMDGISTFHAIRAMDSAKHLPVIFMTAKIQQGEIDEYLAIGAIGVIGKPFDPITLPDEIRQLWLDGQRKSLGS